MSGALVEWGVASRPFPGETVSGDTCLVEERDTLVLASVIDGLGHGEPAATAAAAAEREIRVQCEQPLPEVMRAAHRASAGTRGAAITLARFEPDGVRLLAVGNVAGLVVHADGRQRRVPLRGGIVGFRIPSLGQVDRMDLEPGDHVVLASDGIRSGFTRGIELSLSPAEVAERVLHRCARDTDDATVFVARFRGSG